jgi:hypothetical protein
MKIGILLRNLFLECAPICSLNEKIVSFHIKGGGGHDDHRLMCEPPVSENQAYENQV